MLAERVPIGTSAFDKLLAYSVKEDRGFDHELPCWIWQRALTHDGYGFISVNGKLRRAIRVAYEEFIGPIPEGLTLDHGCRVRACVNPFHVTPITNRENVLKGVGPSAVHARKTHCIRNHEFTPENTIQQKNGRRCRACTNEQARARRSKQSLGDRFSS